MLLPPVTGRVSPLRLASDKSRRLVEVNGSACGADISLGAAPREVQAMAGQDWGMPL